MARRLIGLDVGTNAVTVAEVSAGNIPRLDLFAQVALPRDAMREGEVADDHAVSEAVERLRAEVGLKKTPVRVGLASPRVIVRQVEMPLMTKDELGSALKFQAGELIPIPIDDAVLDFAIVGTDTHEDGQQTMRVLLAAAQEATVARLVAAVEAGGLPVAAVDLMALALTRALAGSVPVLQPAMAGGGVGLADHGVGAEGIVSFGGGVTTITIHEGGIPRFVRVLGTGGRELTDAIATDLAIPAETAEALKRQLGAPSNDELVVRARTSVERPLAILLDEVRSSVDYYRNQPGAGRLGRVVATGGSSQLPGLCERLTALVGVPVEMAQPREHLAIGDIGFPYSELPRLDPYLPAAVGLALGGAGVGTVVDLLPKTKSKSGARSITKPNLQLSPKVVAAIGAGIVLLGGFTVFARQGVSSEKSKKSHVLSETTNVQSQIQKLASVQAKSNDIEGLKVQMQALLGTDVSWTKLVNGFGAALPNGVYLTNFQGTHTLALPPTSSASTTGTTGTSGTSTGSSASSGSSTLAGSGSSSGTSTGVGTTVVPGPVQTPITGTLTFEGFAPDFPSLAAWLDKMAKAPGVADVLLSNAQRGKFGDVDGVTFSASATLTDGARSDRLQSFVKGAR
jgi:type IV pilus assembly protein PilM